MGNYPTDSPLSITASVAGILTFVVAILAAVYVRITYLRNADEEYFQVKTSLSWFKTESTFMQDLISTADLGDDRRNRRRRGSSASGEEDCGDEDEEESLRFGKEKDKEKQMYAFVLDQLGKLEERILECLAEAEESADRANGVEKEERWTIVPRRVRGRTDIAMSWLPVRAKALELVRQRDALGSRVHFAQMSLISSRVRDQELRARKREERQQGRMERLETMACAQHEKLDRLEDLVYRIMHRDRVRLDGMPEMNSMRYDKGSAGRRTTPNRSEKENTLHVQQQERDDLKSSSCDSTFDEPVFSPIPSI